MCVRCVLLGAGMVLLEEVCRCGWALGFRILQAGPVELFLLLPVDRDIEISPPFSALCLLP